MGYKPSLKRKGVISKYKISKSDGSPVDADADYFVLRLDGNKSNDPKHIQACRAAALTYANCIEHHLPLLANELRAKVAQYMYVEHCSRNR